MKHLLRLIAAGVFLLTLNSQFATANAQGTAFTYQGHLNTGGVAANGNYDFRFRLASDPLADNYVGSAYLTNAVPVTNGLFSTTIDFGGGIFTGSNYWLEMDVRTNGNGGYTDLSPLQSVTPMPYAVFANTASNVSGTVSSAQLVGTIPTSQLNGTIPISNVTGTVPLAQLPAAVITNGETGVALSGGFTGTLAGNASSATTAATATITTNVVAGISITNAYITNSVYAGNGSGLTNLNVNASQLNGAAGGNIFVGPSGNSTTTGQYNTALGQGAFLNDTTGGGNTVLGSTALYENSSGYENTAVGELALQFNQSGSLNIAVGYQAGVNNTTGSSNIDIGNPGLSSDTNIIRIGTGQTQTFLAGTINGNGAGLTNLNAGNFSSGTIPLAQLPAIVVTNGSASLTLSGTFSGNGSGLTTLNAANLTSIGLGAGDFYLGTAGNTTTTGQFNTGSGLNALASNTSGNDNTATGSGALHFNTTGSDNTGIGLNALHLNGVGSQNTAVGSGALYNSSGTNNIAIGFNAGDNITTGSSSIDIGNTGVTGDTNITRIGSGQSQTFIAGTINGDGGGLTNLNASQLTSIGNTSGFANFFIGSAGNLTISGSGNMGVAGGSLDLDSSGADNAAFGSGGLSDDTTGSDNTAMGFRALEFNMSGSDNTAIGFRSLQANKTSSDNTAVGSGALINTQTGSNNIAIGFNAGSAYTSNESNNIDIGNTGSQGENGIIRLGIPGIQTSTFIAGTINGDGGGLTNLNASQLTSIGNTSGFANFFIGSAGNLTISGSGNMGVAGGSLDLDSSGADNAAFGSGVLSDNTTGSDNTAMGFRALEFNTNGTDSTAIGFRSLQASKTSFNNTAIGSGTLLNNSTGSNNIAIGYNAGDNITTTSSNIDIGNTGVSTDANIIRIGTSQTATYLVGNVFTPSGTIESSSDRNAKEDFSPVNPQTVLAKIASLPVTEWNYKTAKDVEHIGPMAQDFHAAFGLNGTDDKHISVVDEGGVALAAIQGLNQKLNEKDAEIADLTARLDKLEQLVNQKNKN